MKNKVILQSSLIALLLVVSSVVSASEWKYHVTPFVWGVAQEGKMGWEDKGPGGNTDLIAKYDMSFSDILDKLEGGALISFGGTKDKWSFDTEVIYMHLTEDVDVDPLSTDADIKQTLVHANVYWQAYEKNGHQLDVFGGLRYVKIENEIDIAGSGLIGVSKDIDETESWIEPVVGVRTATKINDVWTLVTRLDIGGFGVGSDLTWHAILGLDQKLGENWSAKYAYRHMDIDYDDDGFIYDSKSFGPAIGMTYRF